MGNLQLSTLDFHGESILVALKDEVLYVPMKARVEALGLQWSSQLQKLNSRKWGMSIIDIPSPSGLQDTACLPLRRFDAWVMSIQPSKVNPELRERLEAYQEELAEVLWKYKSEGVVVHPSIQADPAAIAEAIVTALGAHPTWEQPLAEKIEQSRRCAKGTYEALKTKVLPALERLVAQVPSVLGATKPREATQLLNAITRAASNPEAMKAAKRLYPSLFADNVQPHAPALFSDKEIA